MVFDAPQREDEGMGGGGEVDDFPKQRLVIKCGLWQALHFGGRGLNMAREKIEEDKWGIEDSPCSPISSLPTPTPFHFPYLMERLWYWPLYWHFRLAKIEENMKNMPKIIEDYRKRMHELRAKRKEEKEQAKLKALEAQRLGLNLRDPRALQILGGQEKKSNKKKFQKKTW